jgi:peptidyl-tRNA hydrolase, PTH1 family
MKRLFNALWGGEKTEMENQAFPFLVVGLGNPGREYRDTRHNIGFMVIDILCKEMGISLTRMQSKALVAMGTLDGQKVAVAKPQTYMNLSGQSVGGLVKFYKVPLEQLIIAHDDLDLPLGTLRLRPGGGSAGQKGMASIIQQLGTQEFARLRMGIGRPPGQMNPSAFVLQKFTNAEQEIVNLMMDRALGAVRTFMREGLNTAMNQYNGSLQEK